MNRRCCNQQAQREDHQDQTGERHGTPCRVGELEAILKDRLKLKAERYLRTEHLHAQLVQADLQQRVEIAVHAASIRGRGLSSLQEMPARSSQRPLESGTLTFRRPLRLSSVLTSLKSWVRPDSFHAVLSERSVRWYNACLRITRDADLAADAVQEALLKAWDRRSEFRGQS